MHGPKFYCDKCHFSHTPEHGCVKLPKAAAPRHGLPFPTHRTLAEVAELEMLRRKYLVDGIPMDLRRRTRDLETKEILNNPPPIGPDDAA
jgi:hypothetical protein